jgi:tetratricopeptide (TPR) repeat protein
MGFFNKLFGRGTESESKAKNEVKDALNSFYAIDESKELSIFILKHKKDILLNVIKTIDIRSMPVKKDSPGMRGMQCMKLLEASRELRDFDRKDEMRVCYEKLMELCETEWQEDNIGVYSQVMIGVGKDLMQDTSEPKLVIENMKKAYNAFGSLKSHGIENADALAWQGACSFNLGEEDKARSSLEQALRIEPSHKLANDLAQKLGLDVAVSETKGRNELDFLKDLLASDPDPASFYNAIDKWGFKASEHAAFGSTYKGKSGTLVFFASKSAGKIINAKYSDNKTREIINLVG